MAAVDTALDGALASDTGPHLLDAGADVGSALDAPTCALGTAACVGGRRRLCSTSGAWLDAPCRESESCEGAGVCTEVGGLDLRTHFSAVAWLHSDLGLTEGSAISRGPDGFALGVQVANPWSTATEVRVTTPAMGISTTVPADDGETLLAAWWDAVTRFAPVGLGASVPTESTWEPAVDFGYAASSLPVAAWVASPAQGRAVADPLCTDATRDPTCRARTYEGTLLTGVEGTELVVVSAPLEAAWDRCRGALVIGGVPSIGLSATVAGLTRIHIEASTELAAAGAPSSLIAELEPPGVVAAGASLETGISLGSFQVVARAPTTEEECAPEPGDGCIRPCAPRDVTGTIVTTTQPVTGVASHDCSRLRPGEGACSYATEALLPTSLLGTRHVVPPALPWESEVRARVVAIADATTISVHSGTLDRGAFLDLDVTTGMQVVASAPVAIVRTSRRIGAEGRTATVALLATAHWAESHLVPRGSFTHAIVVAPIGTSLRVDDLPVSGSSTPVGDGEHEMHVVATTGEGLARIATSAPALVLTADIPGGSSSFALSRGARR